MPSSAEPSEATRFDLHSAVESLGDGRFLAQMNRAWWILVGPNGGYVAAIVLRAMQEALADAERSPRSLTLHYLAPPEEGEVEIAVTVERSGRSLTTMTARMMQADRLLIVATAAFSKPRACRAFRHSTMPEVSPPEDGANSSGATPMSAQYDYRWIGSERPDGSAERARIAAWLRFTQPRVLDALALTAYCDALPPALFAVAPRESTRGVPTIELTIHFLEPLPLVDTAADDFVLLTVDSPQLVDGFLEEDVSLWSRDGRLLARSRQLALNV